MAKKLDLNVKNTIKDLREDYGKMPPQATDLEEAVLGALMLEKDAFAIVGDMLKPEVFYKDAHQRIFRAIQKLCINDEPVDLLTVSEALRQSGELEAVGGYPYLSQLTSRVASAVHIEFHVRIIIQKYLQRKLIGICTELQEMAYDDTVDVSDLIDKAQKSVFDIADSNIKKDTAEIAPIIEMAIKGIQSASERPDGINGVPSGFTALDSVTAGWQPSDLVIIAARPAMGKTAFVLSMARNMAVVHKQTVAIFSLEMSAVQLVTRLIAGETELNSEKLKTGKLTSEDWQQLHSRIKALVEAPILVDDTPALSIFELRAKCRRLKQKYNMQIIAKELNIPVIALSQLNRGVEARPDKKPMLSDLRESGSIEQDADMVLFIHRPEKYGITEDGEGNSLRGIASIIIAKHRNGAVGEINLRFRAELTRFENLETSSPFAFNEAKESFTETYSSKMNDEEPPALDQGFASFRGGFDMNGGFEDAPF